jgi:hypothetical protein
MKKYFIVFISILALTSCERAKVRERFTDAKITSDGKTGLFVFKREHYYPGTMGILGPGQPTRYVVNQSIIGSYDIASGEVRVLNRRDNENRYVNESADFHIVELFGSRALIWGNDDKQYWLDINSGALTVVPLKQELEARGREVGEINLVDENGTLIFANKSLGEVMNYSAPQEIWLRSANGEYERIVELPTGSSYGVKRNELYLYSAKERAYLIYNFDSRTKRTSTSEEVPPRRNYDQVIGFHTDDMDRRNQESRER